MRGRRDESNADCQFGIMARFMREGEAFLRPIGDVRMGDREAREGFGRRGREGRREGDRENGAALINLFTLASCHEIAGRQCC